MATILFVAGAFVYSAVDRRGVHQSVPLSRPSRARWRSTTPWTPSPAAAGGNGRADMRARPPNRYELFTCGWKGHVLVGLDAAEVADADPVLVRELRRPAVAPLPALRHAGSRSAAAGHPTSPRRPDPRRDRAAPPGPVAAGPLRPSAHRPRPGRPRRPAERARPSSSSSSWATTPPCSATTPRSSRPSGARPGPTPSSDASSTTSRITPRHLDEAGAGVAAFAALEAVEMVGLWFAKRWAEYLTFVATAALLPLEVYELTRASAP